MEIILLVSKVMLLIGLLICVLFVIKLKRSIVKTNEKAKAFQEELRTFIKELEVAKMERDSRLFVKGLDDTF